ncbi:MAG: hypothetical protein ABIJ43_04100 [Candidatus Beckwithbacteria bacterium]
MKLKLLVYWFIIFSLVIFLFKPILNFYFFQDDFYHFRMSQAYDLLQVLKKFIPIKTAAFYHPLSRLIFYCALPKIFMFNQYYYHLFGLGLFLVNLVLIYYLIKKITKSDQLSLLTSFFYGTNANHYISLTWVAAYHYLLGTFFGLISLLMFIKGLYEKKGKYLFLSFVCILLGLLSEQMTMVIPWLIFAYILLMVKQRKIIIIKHRWFLLSLFGIYLAYFGFRFLYIKIPQIETYQISFDLRVLKNFFWHILWILNIPENFKYQMVSFFKVNPEFTANFKEVNLKIWVGLVLNLSLSFLIPLALLLLDKTKGKIKDNLVLNRMLFGIIWFTISLLPAIFFPSHQYPYYLSIAGIGFLFFFLSPVSWLFEKFKSRLMLGYLIIICLVWYITSIINFQFTNSIHWIKDRQEVSRTYIEMIKEQFPEPKPGTTIILYGAKKIIKHALMNNEAAYFLYQNNNVSLDYSDFEPPKECLEIERKRIKKIEMQANLTEIEVLYQKYQECLTKNKIYFLKKSSITNSTLFNIN